MESLDLHVLRSARDWFATGHTVTLVTVVETWGSAPRPPGALLAIRDDGVVAGSVSGGCVEDDLIARVRQGQRAAAPGLLTYGVTKDEAARFGLPCGGTLRLVQEPLLDIEWLDQLLARTGKHERVLRTLDLRTGNVTLSDAADPVDGELSFDGERLSTWFGPRWRLLIIGAGQLSRVLAQMAAALDYQVLVCDPREEYNLTWDVPGAQWLPGMPDDVVLDIEPDAHTAIVALTHDSKLDDMALLEALKSSAFYIGALGSRANTAKRRERLALFDLDAEQIARLHGPIGLHIGSRIPAEIAVSILAEIISVKNGVSLTQKKTNA
ncbi:MAG TPA: XdhC family protein [Herbaspirillum sp.]|jgi:xanthine dehydrogenase accessory factor|nr:XdhC family protein [Herbaspirillum sp.]